MSEPSLKALAVPPVATGLISEYVTIKGQVAKLEAAAEAMRGDIAQALAADGAMPGTTWELPGIATVAVVKGRVTEKLDRGRLAKAGVSAEVLDAATVLTEGKPTMRITAAKAEEAA